MPLSSNSSRPRSQTFGGTYHGAPLSAQLPRSDKRSMRNVRRRAKLSSPDPQSCSGGPCVGYRLSRIPASQSKLSEPSKQVATAAKLAANQSTLLPAKPDGIPPCKQTPSFCQPINKKAGTIKGPATRKKNTAPPARPPHTAA